MLIDCYQIDSSLTQLGCHLNSSNKENQKNCTHPKICSQHSVQPLQFHVKAVMVRSFCETTNYSNCTDTLNG